MSSLPPLETIPAEISAVSDYEAFARERMSASAWAYFSGGAADEITLRTNRSAFEQLRLKNRLLVDFSTGGHTRCEILGQQLDHPILLAPIAYQRMAHRDGELATALACTATKTPFVVSTHATASLADIARAGAKNAGGFWFQLYMQPERPATLELVRRAEAAGYRAIVVTADAPVSSIRNREQRAQFALPAGIESVNTADFPSVKAQGLSPTELCGGLLRAQPSWKDIEWLRTETRLPILLKGVLTADDAERAIAAGVNGIIVSNHGGRTLDTLPAAIEALPHVAAAVRGRVPILLDGGISRGTDILKAIALGAQGVLIGRAYIYALAAAGAVGVAHVINILRTELEVAMALTGCATLAEIGRDVFWIP
ncbi:MAG TPA: alpha-hydroxy acid oxidase [Opitutaceae bacterium]